MMIPLLGLRGLYATMMRAGVSRYKWRFTRGPAVFEVIFLAEERPFELLLGAIGTRFGTTLHIHPGFLVDTRLPTPDYYALCDALQLTRDSNRKFKPTDFFADLNRSIPPTVNLATGRVQPHDIIAYRPNVDTSDGRYYCGWRDNTVTGKRVQESNLLKTLAVFGQRVHDTCKARNISTCWTHDPARAIDFNL